ncbi:MAG: Xylose isomerase domain protein barrel [Candidatus Solibacter sp.]|nr:Xylose isomerase domain protein barrel [Candidatus Solibacter sp.]
MKIGIVSDEISRDFAEAVRIGSELGICRYEVRNLTAGRAPMCGSAPMLDVEQIAGEAGVEITALSPGMFKLTEDAAAFRREMDEVYPRAAEWAHRWKLPGLIVFGFHKPGATEATAPEFPSASPPEQIVAWLAEAGERAARDGLTLMVEPEPICWCDSGRATAALLARAGSPALRINYDPGNVAWLENRDPLDEFAIVAPWIANVHVKDLRPLTRGAGFPEWVPAGEGMIDYAAHFRALRGVGYDGPVSLEPHMDFSAVATRRCKEALERTWA